MCELGANALAFGSRGRWSVINSLGGVKFTADGRGKTLWRRAHDILTPTHALLTRAPVTTGGGGGGNTPARTRPYTRLCVSCATGLHTSPQAEVLLHIHRLRANNRTATAPSPKPTRTGPHAPSGAEVEATCKLVPLSRAARLGVVINRGSLIVGNNREKTSLSDTRRPSGDNTTRERSPTSRSRGGTVARAASDSAAAAPAPAAAPAAAPGAVGGERKASCFV